MHTLRFGLLNLPYSGPDRINTGTLFVKDTPIASNIITSSPDLASTLRPQACRTR